MTATLTKSQITVLDLAKRCGRVFKDGHCKVWAISPTGGRPMIRVHHDTITGLVRKGLLIREENPGNPMLVHYTLPTGD